MKWSQGGIINCALLDQVQYAFWNEVLNTQRRLIRSHTRIMACFAHQFSLCHCWIQYTINFMIDCEKNIAKNA